MKIETSIIIPAFNAGNFIEKTIESVLNQTYKYWELIIIDDGSTDNTFDLIEKYLSDSRIHYVYQKNSGVSSARNNGISNARGIYIAFLDADDIWEPENLEVKTNVLKNGIFDWTFSDMKTFNSQSEYSNYIMTGTDENILRHYLLWDRTVVPGPCSNIVIKRKCIDNGLRFDTNFSTAADQDFCFNLSSKYVGYRINKSLCSYRILTNSMSRNISLMEKDHIAVYKKALENNLFDSFLFKQKCFSNLYLILAGSWWINGNNKVRGLYFIIKSVLNYPPQIINLIKKLWK